MREMWRSQSQAKHYGRSYGNPLTVETKSSQNYSLTRSLIRARARVRVHKSITQGTYMNAI